MPVGWIGRWGEWRERDCCSGLFSDLYMIPMIRPNTSFFFSCLILLPIFCGALFMSLGLRKEMRKST